jgi:methionyl-tRNA formyltransferase
MTLRIALFGQAAFGRDVLVRLLDAGHELVAVYAPPEGARPDPLAAEATVRGLPVLRHGRFRQRGQAIPERVAEHAALGADLNVLAYVTAILPVEIVDAPPRRSLCFHPSLLPRFRGGAALAWQIMLGERESGVTVFQPDAGVDTGPIVVQMGGVEIGPRDTAGSLYFQKLYPLGVEAVVEAVRRVDRGTAELRPQDESKASFQGLVDDAVARLDFARPVEELDRWIRGCDPQPGVHARLAAAAGPGAAAGATLRLFDGYLVARDSVTSPPGSIVSVEGGRMGVAARGGLISVGRVRVGDGPKQAPDEAGIRAGQRLE